MTITRAEIDRISLTVLACLVAMFILAATFKAGQRSADMMLEAVTIHATFPAWEPEPCMLGVELEGTTINAGCTLKLTTVCPDRPPEVMP